MALAAYGPVLRWWVGDAASSVAPALAALRPFAGGNAALATWLAAVEEALRTHYDAATSILAKLEKSPKQAGESDGACLARLKSRLTLWFAVQLVKMISECEEIKFEDGVLVIPSPAALEKRLPDYYSTDKYTSFQSQLNIYGYRQDLLGQPSSWGFVRYRKVTGGEHVTTVQDRSLRPLRRSAKAPEAALPEAPVVPMEEEDAPSAEDAAPPPAEDDAPPSAEEDAAPMAEGGAAPRRGGRRALDGGGAAERRARSGPSGPRARTSRRSSAP
ncbi:hypothetical protein SO694_00004417 [Aureococcus anophagefferens]|uniref:HSF-type DNA-binding domain-containing protein n=1 Tax=Aureococcus anophagefferens TaxID=44056 RepID=A0ABR1G993_AURAN